MLGALGLGACLGPTQEVAVAPRQVLHVNTRDAQFPNGMHVILETVEDPELAGVALAVDAGSTNDPANQLGLAHLVEHSVFEAKHGDTPTVERRLNQLAASFNAYTSHDAVVYHALAPARAFEPLLAVFADIAAEPVANVDEAAFAHEREVVEAERGVRSEHVQGQVQSYLYRDIFAAAHPYSRPVIGTRESIAGLTLDMAQTFTAAHYKPENMTLYVFAPSSLDAFSRVSAAFEKRAGGALAPAQRFTKNDLRSSEDRQAPGKLTRHEASVASPALWLAWSLPSASLEARAQARSLAELANDLIRPSFTSHGAVAHATCSLYDQVLADVLACELTLNDASNPEDVLTRSLADLRHGFGDVAGNHDWARTVERDAAIEATLAFENPDLRAISGAERAQKYDNPFLDFEVVDRLSSLDLGKVTALGFQLADREHTYAMLVEPASGSGERRRQATHERRAQEALEDAPDAQATLTLVRPAASREISKFQLENGLTVIAERHPGTRFVSAILGFRGSSEWASDPALGKAAAFAETWHVESAPSDAGLSLRWDEGQDDRHFVARAVSPDLNATLKALAGQRYPHFEWPNLRYRRMLPALTRQESAPDAVAEREEQSALFGSHPYSAFAPAARADSVRSQAVDRFLLSMRRPDNAVLVIVSDFEPKQLRANIEDYFGSWSKPREAKLEAPPTISFETSHHPSLIVVDKPSPQVDLRFSCVLPHGESKARATEELLTRTLAVQAEDFLRHRTGIAYFANGEFHQLAAGVDEITISTSVDTPYVGQALEFLQGLGQMSPEDIADRTLGWQRYQSLEEAAFENRTTATSADLLYRAWLDSRSLESLARAPELIAGITQADFKAPLTLCGGHAAIVAVGNREAIVAAEHH